MSSRAIALTLPCILIAVVATAPPASAAAPEGVLGEMIEINRKALDELRLGQNDAARTDLLRAVSLGKRAGLGSHQMMARTYLHLGAVYLTGYGDRAKALQQLISAVKLRPDIQITPQLLTPSLQETFEEARAKVTARPVPRPAPAAARPASDSAPAQPTPPPEPTPPLVATSEPSALSAPAAPPPSPAAPPEGELATRAEQRPARAIAPQPFWVGLGVGSAVGWHGRRDLETQDDFFVPSGVATAALVHLSPEIGYRLGARTALSLQSRHQVIPVTGTVESGVRPRMAHAVFLRLHRLLKPFGDRAELWGTAALGAGSAIRLYIPQRPAAGLPASDTIDVGPLAFGPGLSLVYRTSPHVAIVGEVRMMAAVWQFAALADLGVGALYAF
jgi:hypothetical protein